ncbi:DMT family transporter [Rhodoblastus acidophilus]|uniref:DMT family transporter n=1 Tax=Candidatus Rhodoblastus alkanivorans TaxID=2954117 RepID=A0ABS9Z6T1_9HYPH|nr:DMT family transporter [Candidatus Rhodoblastus alkanivorans]MCI4679570.1 DMT family transporter [Candidatus Rhodoblastus alkanivorans]MCI4683321.1 DMT family transporter [Candidatus Rhodoblastus alkanivorans]MDI4640634.1 DMT family transporter [Rhodoblastus acidophilus]
MTPGILLKILSTLAFTAMAVGVRVAAPRIPLAEIVFFRSIVALVLLFLWLVWTGGFPRHLTTRRPLGHLGRGLTGAAGMFANFGSLTLLPLADATAYFYASPIFVTLIAARGLRENVHVIRWLAVLIGFGGVLAMLTEHVGLGHLAKNIGAQGLGAGVALAGAAFAAVSIIQTRRLTASEHTAAIVFYFTCLTTLAGAAALILAHFAPSLIASQAFVTPDARDLAALIGAGLMGGCAQIFVTTSYRYADASLLASYDYFAMVWAVIASVVFFGQWPSTPVMFGAAAIAGSGLLALLGERAFAGRVTIRSIFQTISNFMPNAGRPDR